MSNSIWHSLAMQARGIAQSALAEVNTCDDWERLRPGRLLEFRRCLGLDPWPARCDARVTELGAFAGEGFEARKIAFQIMPDCWSSATVYYPVTGSADHPPAPAVLYLCGHAPIGAFHYQYHPMMWARRGYVCLILDTIEQHDNAGEHHGSVMGKQDRWLAMGYTAAGGELWNSLRALDVLAADPRVDANRLAVTGVSGGGAMSFFLAAVDERVKAVSTLCGISPPVDAIANRHLLGHCDCFYPLNLYGRDISEYAALIAPRAALFCFAADDQLFHMQEIQAFVERTRRCFTILECPERCELVTCPGPHGDHREFDEATSRWFDRYVAGEERPSVPRGGRELSEAVTSIFQGRPPTPDHLGLLPELLSPAGSVPLPQGAADWPALRAATLHTLVDRAPALAPERRPAANLAQTGDWCWGVHTRMREHRGCVDHVDIWLNVVFTSDAEGALVISVAGEGETTMHALSRLTTAIDPGVVGYAGFEPRMSGFNAPASQPPAPPAGSRFRSTRTLLLAAMALTGTSPVVMTTQDLLAAADYLLGHPATRRRKLYLYGRGDGAAASLYGALMDERIAGVVLEDLPGSHLDGAPIPAVRRAIDIHHAVGLMAPRKVALVTPGHGNWTWAGRVYERLGCPDRFIMAADLRRAFDKILA